MAISVLDVRDTFALPGVVPPRAAAPAASTTAPRRLPVTVLVAAAVGLVEALALLALGLTALDGLLAAGGRPHGGLVALGLVGLACWVVAAAGSGATLVDGTGRRGYVAVAYTELFAVSGAGVAAAVVPVAVPATQGLPLPALVLLLMAVPIGKLLLAGSASAQQWLAAGPRPRERRPDPVAGHRLICTLTIAAIGLGLGAVAIGGPQPEGPTGAGTAATSVVADR